MNPAMAAVELRVDGRDLSLRNLDKVLWPDVGLTKRDLLEYYRAVGPALLPHLRGRACTLVRYPDGVEGPGWYQANCRGAPGWMRIAEVPNRTSGGTLRYAVVEDGASLLWLANLGTLELHPFLSRVDLPEQPTAVVFDLDPAPPSGLVECARLALAIRDRLAASGLHALAKTSGRAGLHLYVPIRRGPGYPETKAFARGLAERVAVEHPELALARMGRRADRHGRVLIDWGQNDGGKSTVAPYSLRAARVPIASAPLRWEEVERAAAGQDTRGLVLSAPMLLDRLERWGDLFAGALDPVQALPVTARS